MLAWDTVCGVIQQVTDAESAPIVSAPPGLHTFATEGRPANREEPSSRAAIDCLALEYSDHPQQYLVRGPMTLHTVNSCLTHYGVP